VIFAEETTPEFDAGSYKETDGNPFFIEEVSKALIDSGQVYFDGVRWKRPPDMADLEIPQSIKVALQTRLSRLSKTTQEILLNAAVIGRDFDFETLQQVIEKDEGALIDGLEAALKAQLIEELNRGEGERFWFTHALIPAALRESISGLRRTRLHRMVARVLEATNPKAYRRLAHHWGEGGDEEKGLDYTIKAADKARQTYANEDAIRLYTEALALLPEDHENRFDLLATRVALYDITTEREAQRADIDAMLVLAEKQQDNARLVDAYLALAKLYQGIDNPKAREPAEFALGIARETGDTAREARSSYFLGVQHRASGDPHTARRYLEDAIELVRETGATHDLAKYSSFRALVYFDIGDQEAVHPVAKEAVALSSEIKDKRLEMTVTRRLAASYWSTKNYTEALNIAETNLAMAREIGDIEGELNVMNLIALILQGLKRFEEAETCYLETLQVTEIFSSISMEHPISNIGGLYEEMGEYEKNLFFYEDLLKKAQLVENDYWIFLLKDHHSLSLSYLGKYRDSLEIRQSNWPYIEKSLDRGTQADQLGISGMLAAAVGDFELGYRYLEDARKLCDGLEESPNILYVLLYSAYVALLDGKFEALKVGLEQITRGMKFLQKFQVYPTWSFPFILAGLHLAFLDEDPSHGVEAQLAIEEALVVFEDSPFCGLPWESLFFLASRVFRANQHYDIADDYLRQAYERVRLVARNIKDDDLKQSYQENVPHNREIIAQYQKKFSS